MLMHGFTGKLLARLVRMGFVTCKAEHMRIGRRVAYVPPFRILRRHCDAFLRTSLALLWLLPNRS
jgi:hypothetical protein